MTVTLNLTPEEDVRLRRKAAQAGLDETEYLRQMINQGAPSEDLPKTPAEILAYWDREGLSGIWADRTDIPDSPEYARQLRQEAEYRNAPDLIIEQPYTR